jgi:hypothetical protein
MLKMTYKLWCTFFQIYHVNININASCFRTILRTWLEGNHTMVKPFVSCLVLQLSFNDIHSPTDPHTYTATRLHSLSLSLSPVHKRRGRAPTSNLASSSLLLPPLLPHRSEFQTTSEYEMRWREVEIYVYTSEKDHAGEAGHVHAHTPFSISPLHHYCIYLHGWMYVARTGSIGEAIS